MRVSPTKRKWPSGASFVGAKGLARPKAKPFNLRQHPAERRCQRNRREYNRNRLKLSLPGRDNSIVGRRDLFDSCRVLIVSSDSLQCKETEEVVSRLGLQSVRCGSLMDARACIDAEKFQFVLCGDDLPDCNLRTAVRVLLSSTGGAPVIVLSHLADWDAYMRALSAGAFDYIACPPDPAESDRILRLALAQNPPPMRASHTAA